MDIYEIKSIEDRVRGNSYVGRGIVIGKTADGKKACTAYFIMGRSANSRNRVFAERDGAVFTEPFDASKVEDPSLIIYAALRTLGNKLIVTNGDQTDTIYEFLADGKTFEQALGMALNESGYPTEADVITMGIGNASFGAYMLHRVTDALGVFGANLEGDEIVDLEDALIDEIIA